MTGDQPQGDLPPGTPPPEVAEEFAAAYREAYLRALADQSSGARHVDAGDHDDTGDDTEPADEWAHRLPRRPGPLRQGGGRLRPTHPATRASYGDLRRSPWFGPVLLVVAILVLVLVAYLGGRLLSAVLSSSDSEGQGDSSTSVTGPSLTSATLMSAPNTPVSTRVPAPRSAVQTAS